MALANSFDTNKRAKYFKGDFIFFCPLENVDAGTIAKLTTPSSDWERLPAMEAIKIKPVFDNDDVTLTSGTVIKDRALIGCEITSSFLQNDIDTINLWKDYVGVKGILFAQGHRLRRLATPIQTYLMAFGQILPSDGEYSSDDGKVAFMFNGLQNAQAIVLTGTPASGKVEFPTVTGFTAPGSDLTLPAADYTNGVYAFVKTT